MNEADVLKEFEIEGLSEAYLSGADLYEANLSGVDLSRADLCDCDLVGADLSGANLRCASLHDANLSRADLRGANLSEAELMGADLSGANLSGADLSRANLFEANLHDADLRGANLSGTNLFDTNLSGADLLGVTGLASMKEEMEMLILLREQIRKESFVFSMDHFHGELSNYWHGEESPNNSSFDSLLNTCGTTHCGAGFCQVELAKEGNPIALTSASIVGSYAIPSMAWLFPSSKEEFIVYLDKLISGECPLLQR